eukprot:COSAG01_NODE_438_length_17037_cov_13.150136_12_plen_97_part_00
MQLILTGAPIAPLALATSRPSLSGPSSPLPFGSDDCGGRLPPACLLLAAAGHLLARASGPGCWLGAPFANAQPTRLPPRPITSWAAAGLGERIPRC